MNVRVIAATNRPLQQEIETGEFRNDLYHHLSVLTLEVPPPRERCEDIPDLVEYFQKTRATDPKIRLTEDAIGHLMDYRWPGNICELLNTLERSLIFLTGNELSASSLYIQTRTAVPLTQTAELPTLD